MAVIRGYALHESEINATLAAVAAKEYEREVGGDYVPPYEVSCDTCTAQCCRAPTEMTLSNLEFQQHRHSIGVKVVIKPRPYLQRFDTPQSWVMENGETRFFQLRGLLPSEHGVYKLEQDCGNLQPDHSCGIYEQRPWACQVFELGSPACLRMRRAAGLDADQPDLEDIPLANESAETGALSALPIAVPIAIHVASEVLAFESEWILSTLQTMEESSWRLPTSCAGWNVGDVVSHLITGQQLVVDVMRSMGGGADVVSRPEFVGDGPECLGSLVEVLRDVAVAVANVNASPEDFVTIDGTTITFGAFTQLTVAELTMHAADIAHALGMDHPMPAAGILASAVALPGLLDHHESTRPNAAYSLRCPEFTLSFSWQNGAWFGEEGRDPCVIEGSAQELISFAYGRVNLDGSGLTTNKRNFAQAFKRYLAGP